MANVNFEARATLQSGAVSWKLCHLPPGKPEDCGNAKSPFPDVVLGVNQTYHFKFTIKDQTGLGIKFSNDPIWIQDGSQPTGPIIDSQVTNLSVNTNRTELSFTDKNDKPNDYDPDPVVLKYQLNFVDQNNNPVVPIDPDITNGGTNTRYSESPDGREFWNVGSGEFWAFMAAIFIVSLLATIAARFIRFGRPM